MVTSSNFNVAPKRYHAHIVGWGMCAPETILSNKDLEAILETNDEWIQARTGIKERRIVGEKESTSTLAIRAAQRALEVTDILPADIDLIIVATSTPENIFPSTASIVQHKLGANAAGAFDLSAACSGFVYGMDMATQAIRSGSIKTAIVIGAETMTRVMNWRDRSTCILFGDGAGAVVLQRQDRVGGVLSTVMRSDGSGADLLAIPTLGNLEIRDQGGLGEHELHKMYMSGSEVFKFAARIIKPSILEALSKANVKLEDVKLIIPHQANERIIQAAARSLDVERERFITNLDRYGNTSAASIPIALNEALEKGLINQGDHIVFIGFGGGLSWGTVVMRWSIPQPGARPINRYYQQRRRASYAIVRLRTWWRKLRRAVSELIAPMDYDEDDFTDS